MKSRDIQMEQAQSMVNTKRGKIALRAQWRPDAVRRGAITRRRGKCLNGEFNYIRDRPVPGASGQGRVAEGGDVLGVALWCVHLPRSVPGDSP